MSDSPRDRYYRDAQFKKLVDVQIELLRNCDFSPTELREAAVLAHTIYYERHLHKSWNTYLEIGH